MIFGLLKAAVYLVAGGALIYAAKKLIDQFKSISDLLEKSASYVANVPKRIADAATEAKDSLVKQSKQSSRERRGDKYFGSALDIEAQKNAEAARAKREEEEAKRPTVDRKAKLKEQIESVKKANSAGIFDNGVFLPLADLEREYAAIGGT